MCPCKRLLLGPPMSIFWRFKHDGKPLHKHMSQPRQLARVRKSKHSSRPIIERMRFIAIRDIAELIPTDDPLAKVNPDFYGWRYPGQVLLTARTIKTTDAGAPQLFPFKLVRTGKGKPRPLIICQCRRSTQFLYHHNGRYACKRCHRAHYLSQRQSKAGRKLWKAAKKRIKVNAIPRPFDSIPSMSRYKHHKRYKKLVQEIQQLEAQARHSTIKGFDIGTLAYHLR